MLSNQPSSKASQSNDGVMNEEKCIVIGCDETINLSVILEGLKRTAFFSYNIITATRISDLTGIVKSLNPDLIILCLRNNQLVLRDFNTVVKKPEVPILCLTKKFESEILNWAPNSIVFTIPLEHISKDRYLTSRINSIFLLKSLSPAGIERNTAANVAIQLNHFDSSRDSSRHVLELDQKIAVLLKIKERIAELYSRVDDPTRMELTSIVNSIKLSLNDNKFWDDFKLYFEQTSPNFLFLLAQKYPDLTPIDLKYCCYVKMNMSNDDIRNLLGINQESVRTHKYRLKRKMALPRDQDLRSFLQSVS